MSYNDGNNDYAVYSNNKWASADAQTIIAADNYKIASETEKQWWLANSNLTESNLTATASLRGRKATRIKI